MITIAELARALDAEVFGDGELFVSGAAEPASAAPDEIALAMQPAFAGDIARGRARAAILWPGADWKALGLESAIIAPRPRYVLAGITRLFERAPEIAPGIHSSAVIDPSAEIGEDAAIGPFVFIGARVRIGSAAQIFSHVSIAEDARIGSDALVLSGVRIGARVRIGDRFIAQPGAVIGADGFSFVTPSPGLVEQARATGAITAEDQDAYVRINSLGSVVLGDDVEVGANACIDRGTIADTTVGDGTKIDNQVQIGHNVRIGQHVPRLRPGRHRRVDGDRRPGGARRSRGGGGSHQDRLERGDHRELRGVEPRGGQPDHGRLSGRSDGPVRRDVQGGAAAAAAAGAPRGWPEIRFQAGHERIDLAPIRAGRRRMNVRR